MKAAKQTMHNLFKNLRPMMQNACLCKNRARKCVKDVGTRIVNVDMHSEHFSRRDLKFDSERAAALICSHSKACAQRSMQIASLASTVSQYVTNSPPTRYQHFTNTLPTLLVKRTNTLPTRTNNVGKLLVSVPTLSQHCW